MENRKKKENPYFDTIVLAIGELIVSAVTILIFVLLGKFDYKVVTGAALGSLVMIANFFALSVAVDKAINRFIEMRGSAEMDDEEAEEFAKKQGMAIQNMMTKSYLTRSFTMIAALIIALLTKQFNVIATAVPLLMQRPLIYASEFIKRKRGE